MTNRRVIMAVRLREVVFYPIENPAAGDAAFRAGQLHVTLYPVEKVAAYQADKLVHDRISARLARFIATAGPATVALAPQWKVPTLLMYAGQDALVRAQGSRDFAAAAPAEHLSSRYRVICPDTIGRGLSQWAQDPHNEYRLAFYARIAADTGLPPLFCASLSAYGGQHNMSGIDADADPAAVRARVGYMPEHDCLPSEVSAAEFVTHLARMSGLPATAAKARPTAFSSAADEERPAPCAGCMP